MRQGCIGFMGRCCLASQGKVMCLSCVFLLYLQEHLCIEGIWAFLEPVSSIHPVPHSSLHGAVSSSTATCSTRLRKDLLVLHPSSVPGCPQTLHGRYQTTSVPAPASALPPHPLPKEGSPFRTSLLSASTPASRSSPPLMGKASSSCVL